MYIVCFTTFRKHDELKSVYIGKITFYYLLSSYKKKYIFLTKFRWHLRNFRKQLHRA